MHECIHTYKLYTYIHTYIHALQNLSKRDDIIITKADKGGAVVIVDDYVQEANRKLDNKEFYKKIPIDTTEIN